MLFKTILLNNLIINYNCYPMKDRLKQAFNYARVKGLVSTQKELASMMKATQASISKAMKGDEQYLTPSFMERFNTTFGDIFNESWLLEGEGEMLKDEPKGNAGFKSTMIREIPLISQYAQAGYLCGFADEEYIATLPTIPFSVDHQPKGEYVAFEVRGDSMFDNSYRSLMEGDLLMCRKIDKDYWSSKLHFKRWNYFVIVSQEEGVLVKEIIDHDVDNGIVTLHSLNPLYDDIKLHLSTISQIFSVVKIDRSGDK